MVTPCPLPTANDLIDAFGLPPEYQHMESMLRSPAGNAMVQALAACVAQGMPQPDIEAAATQIAQLYQRDTHRCSACLCWTKNFQAGAVVDDTFHLFIICARCQKLIAQGRATPTMRRNAWSYVNGGANEQPNH